MIELLKYYFNIAFLMQKPQDVPAGETQMHIGIALNFISYVLASILFLPFSHVLSSALIDITCTALLFYGGLYITQRVARFHQSFGAFCGASAILNCISGILLLLTMPNEGEELSQLTAFCQFWLLVWGLSLTAHVLRHTFEIPMVASILAAVAYYLLLISVT